MAEAPCLAIVPTRGRAATIGQFLDAFNETAVCTDLIFCLDADDPDRERYKTIIYAAKIPGRLITWHTGRRQGLVEWTNRVAGKYDYRYEALISLGDDHRPVTPGWDRELLAAARMMGGGWAYGDDGLQHENLPTAFLVSSRIVQALGWMLLPTCRHMFVDAAARDLAETVHRRRYLPDVHIKHLHHTSGLSVRDQTYDDAYASWDADRAAYEAWLAGGMHDDAETVREALR
jgi:hypothetical protein